jgi:uncharacterized protein
MCKIASTPLNVCVFVLSVSFLSGLKTDFLCRICPSAVTRLIIFFAWLLVCLSANIWAESPAAAPPYVFANTQMYSITATTGLKHQLIITLPESYAAQKDKGFPVVYYLDAYWDFPLLYSVFGNLRYDRAIPEVILVGLSVPPDTQINAYRALYFTLAVNPNENLPTGRADVLYHHLIHDIVPYIDSHYRTQATPSGRVLAGQSKGGLFALYGLYQKPAVFQRFVAINPAVIGNDNALNMLDAQQKRESKTLTARVFISHGSEEYTPFRDAIIRFKQQIQKRHYTGLLLRNQVLDGMGHTGGKGEAYGKGLLWVLQDLTPKEKSGLQVDMGG